MKRSVHYRCPIPGMDIDIQEETDNFLGDAPGAEHIEDRHTFVEVTYDGTNPFIPLPAFSWVFVILHANKDGLTAEQDPDSDANIYILAPGHEFKAVIVSERLPSILGTKPGISVAFRVSGAERQKIWFGDTIYPYGSG